VAAQREAARPSVELLRAGQFEPALDAAQKVIAHDGDNAQARAVAALTRFLAAAHRARGDVMTLGAQVMAGSINDEYFRFSLERLRGELTKVEADLAVASAHPEFELELCLACWEHDWNGNGEVDNRDRRLLEIEIDTDGHDLPEGDARRRPTFHFDVGDLFWARAMVDFQRALVEVLLAYRWDEAARLPTVVLFHRSNDAPASLHLPLRDRAGIGRARTLVLAGLEQADRARRAYLDERDDDREWVPNPRQKSHPLPLPVDDALFQTWAEVAGDLSRLVRGDEGLDVAAVAQLGNKKWDDPPRGFVDIGRLFRDPGDIVVPLDFKSGSDRADLERLLHGFFGAAYVPSMKPTPLLGRMTRMRDEIERGGESFERKLRYLFWLN
jgi:hypothetical protein